MLATARPDRVDPAIVHPGDFPDVARLDDEVEDWCNVVLHPIARLVGHPPILASANSRWRTPRYRRHERGAFGQDADVPIELPPDYEAFKSDVVSDQRDDEQGVYEVWWQANSRYPDLPLSARLAIAEAIVIDLVREGRVLLVSGEWIAPDSERAPVPEPEEALRAFATWVPQPGQPVVWMSDA